uniref:Uncharacterized protein n=1 Tax=Fagus sylvatica TaxID=28930 RepID=A0A2N9ETA8_FAGSY
MAEREISLFEESEDGASQLCCDRGREQVDLVHFPLPSPPLSLSFVGTATSSLSANRWVL